MRAFAATDTYIIHYDLNGGNAFSGTDVLIDGNGNYYSSKTSRYSVSAKPTTAEKRSFYKWRATGSDGTTKEFTAGSQIDAAFFTQLSTSEDGSQYEVTLKAVWYTPYLLVKNFVRKNGQSGSYTVDKLFPPDDTTSALEASNLDNSNYDNENYAFVGWTKDSTGNGGRHMAYADYVDYTGLIENGQVPVTDFIDETDSKWDADSHRCNKHSRKQTLQLRRTEERSFL